MKKEMNNYDIQKDNILKKWIVWELHPNYMVEIYRARTKKECKQWLEENIK